MSNHGFYTLLFHSFYDATKQKRPLHPVLNISTDEFDKCLSALLNHGFYFLNPDDPASWGDKEKGILLTFDDGYFNNFLILPILDKYKVTAVLFAVSEQVLKQQRFWWDVYYSALIIDKPFEVIYKELQQFKKIKSEEIRKKLESQLYPNCFQVIDDADRPMTAEELYQFSKHPRIKIGVHSRRHEILTLCENRTELLEEIGTCKTFLEDIVKQEITLISYPNGNFNSEIIDISFEMGFMYGLTTVSGLNDPKNLTTTKANLQLKRNVFPIPNSDLSVVEQLEAFGKDHG
jgi:peptidoglycan/xylan/chitin deacetylase (PgdA/CDA1 family)